MKEVLFQIGPLKVHGYGLMIAIGVLAAYFVTERRAKKAGLEPDTIFDLMMWCLAGGAIGSKLLYVITEFPRILQYGFQLSDLIDGFVVYGGIIGGILFGFLYTKRKKLPFLKYFDLVMPSVALAQAFGRIGCFLAGCCYGRETKSAFGVVFHDSHYAPNGVALIPTQLLSSAANLLHFFLLLFLAKRVKHDGQVAGLYLIFYSIGRFLIEFLRDDPRGAVGALSTSQFIAIFILAAGLFVFFLCGRKQKATAQEND